MFALGRGIMDFKHLPRLSPLSLQRRTYSKLLPRFLCLDVMLQRVITAYGGQSLSSSRLRKRTMFQLCKFKNKSRVNSKVTWSSLSKGRSNISCVPGPRSVMPDEALVFLARVVTGVVFVCRARAIGFRQHNSEAVGGFFSQIGNLYMVHHLWGTVRRQL